MTEKHYFSDHNIKKFQVGYMRFIFLPSHPTVYCVTRGPNLTLLHKHKVVKQGGICLDQHLSFNIIVFIMP